MNPVTSLWYGVDALTEKYPTIGGYVYCAGDPVKLKDPDRRDQYDINDSGEIIKVTPDNNQ